MFFTILLAFKRLNDPSLLVFGQNVVEKTKGNAVYEPEQAQVLKVETATKDFEAGIAGASTGDREKIKKRNEKRLMLESELTLLGMMLELRKVDDETFYTSAGYEVRSKPVRNRQPFDQPSIKSLRQGTLSGTVAGEAKELPEGVTQLAIEQSPDGGAVWQNGSYANGKRFVIKDLEPRKEYLVRIRYLGTHQRMSDWSKAVKVFVQ